MPSSHTQSSLLCRRGLAVCLVWMLSFLAWQTAAEATCGDYLMSHGGIHQPAVTSQPASDLLESNLLPVVPFGCPNGECRSPHETPAPAGSTTDHRIVDDLRSTRWAQALNDRTQNSGSGLSRPTDEPLPDSPFAATLERPPQTTLV